MRSARLWARRSFLAAALVAAAACAHHPLPPPEPPREPPPRAEPEVQRPREPEAEVGLASFYGKRFHGHRTASGDRYDMHAMTCAHRTLPFGTRLRVTDLDTGRSVEVTVTDRGPYARGRVVDLSLAAARRLGIVKKGLTRVRLEKLADGDDDEEEAADE